MDARRALITGITGQDGSYLAELLLSKGYEVHGIKRRSSSFNTGRIDHIFDKLHLHHGDMTDGSSLLRILQAVRPQEIYNLAAQSHVDVSFEEPEYTANADALGTLRILEAIRCLKLNCRFYQASSSEIFGNAPAPQNEETPCRPRSPYGCAKAYAHWITVNYREAYGLWAVNGIMFNHESPRRGETFVTRKIVRGLVRCHLDADAPPLRLGNLDACRDWGHARDYASAMWLMLQRKYPSDLVIATGVTHSVRQFLEGVSELLGHCLSWSPNDSGAGFWKERQVVNQDQAYVRKTDINLLLGDARLARKLLKWKPTICYELLVAQMVQAELLANTDQSQSSPPVPALSGLPVEPRES